MSKEKAVRKSFSLPQDIADMFEVEARLRDLHASVLLTPLLKNWLMFDLLLQKIGGTVSVPELLFWAIIDNIAAINCKS